MPEQEMVVDQPTLKMTKQEMVANGGAEGMPDLEPMVDVDASIPSGQVPVLGVVGSIKAQSELAPEKGVHISFRATHYLFGS